MVSAGLPTFRQKRAKKALSKAEVRERRKITPELAAARRICAPSPPRCPIGPFGGLIGGIIHAFRDIAGAQGAGGFETVSQGISEALVATALGLVVAIPAAWMFNYLSGRIDRLSAEMENSSSELLDFFLDLDEGAEA